jgi:hypothetical protein
MENQKMLAIMQWFRHHLNWTSVFIVIVSALVGFLLINLVLFVGGLSHLTYPGNSRYIFDFQVEADIANLICLFGFGWVLRQKKRGLGFLGFFMPLFIPYPYFIIMIPIWLIGFIIMLSIENKSNLDKESIPDNPPN